MADESVAGPIIHRLRADGWTVLSICDGNTGASDPAVLALALQEEAVLLTEDKDFGELVYRDQLEHAGVVLIRIEGLRRDLRAEVVSEAVRQHRNEFGNAFSVISPNGVRIRQRSDSVPGLGQEKSA